MIEKFDMGIAADLSHTEHREAWARIRDKIRRVLCGMSCCPSEEVSTFSSHASAPTRTTAPSTSTQPQPQPQPEPQPQPQPEPTWYYTSTSQGNTNFKVP
jgi:predicted component of type VI protein secretion system